MPLDPAPDRRIGNQFGACEAVPEYRGARSTAGTPAAQGPGLLICRAAAQAGGSYKSWLGLPAAGVATRERDWMSWTPTLLGWIHEPLAE